SYYNTTTNKTYPREEETYTRETYPENDTYKEIFIIHWSQNTFTNIFTNTAIFITVTTLTITVSNTEPEFEYDSDSELFIYTPKKGNNMEDISESDKDENNCILKSKPSPNLETD